MHYQLVLIGWPPYKVGLMVGGEEVYECQRVLVLHGLSTLLSAANDADIVKRTEGR